MTPRIRDLLLLAGALALTVTLTRSPDRLALSLLGGAASRGVRARADELGLLTIFVGTALVLGANLVGLLRTRGALALGMALLAGASVAGAYAPSLGVLTAASELRWTGEACAGAALLALAVERLPAGLLLAFPLASAGSGLAGRLLLLWPPAALGFEGVALDRMRLLVGAGLAIALATIALTTGIAAPDPDASEEEASRVQGVRLARLVALVTIVVLGAGLLYAPSLYGEPARWGASLVPVSARGLVSGGVDVLLLGTFLTLGAGLGRGIRFAGIGTGLVLALAAALPAARPLALGLGAGLAAAVASLVALRVAVGLPSERRLAAGLAFYLLAWALNAVLAGVVSSVGSGAAKTALGVLLVILVLALFLPDRPRRPSRPATHP